MQVTVKYAAQIKQAAGIASEEIDVDEGGTVQQLLTRVADSHGPKLKSLLLHGDGRVHRSILVFIGEEQVRGEAPVPLRNQDVVTILSPISGG